MKSRAPKHEYAEGPQAVSRFATAIKKILSVSRDEIEQREKRYQKEQALKPKRGPKGKPLTFRFPRLWLR